MICVNWGGGVNSTAVLVLFHQASLRPDVIVFADPGSEWPETYRYRDEVLQPWLASIGFPPVLTLRGREGTQKGAGLRAECSRLTAAGRPGLPSIAFGFKTCSLKFKRDVVMVWGNSYPPFRATWAAGEKVKKVVGIDAGEKHRIRPFTDPREAAKYELLYPLVAAGWDREACVRAIREEGLPVPTKSACYFCPNNTDAEWIRLRDTHPELWADAVQMEREALPLIDEPRRFGLRRRGKVGEKHISSFAFPRACSVDDDDDDQACDCKD